MIEYQVIIKIKNQVLRSRVSAETSHKAWLEALPKVEGLESLGIKVKSIKLKPVELKEVPVLPAVISHP